MKKILNIPVTTVGIILCSLSSFAQTKKQPLSISHLTGDFYVYTTFGNYDNTPYPSNSLYLVTSDGVVMFDVPWDTTQLQPLLDGIYKRHHKHVILCIATHYHADRTAGLNALKEKGIRTYSSKLTYTLCKQHNDEQAQYTFTNDTTFTIGNHTFQTYYPGAGHTPDNIVVWFPKEKVLYGGCIIKSIENTDLGNLSDATISAWPVSIYHIMDKCPNPLYVIPGHLSWKDKNSPEHTLKLLKEYKASNK